MRKTGRGRRLEVPVSPTDHVRGSPLAKVTLVGYGDFTCPDCAKSYRAVKKIQAKMGSRLRYVFRSFSQASLDGDSEGAAEAAESAGAQGKFWEIHDRMFENQGASDQLQLAKHAKALGLDVRQFRRDMRGHVHLARIRVAREAGVRSGVVQVAHVLHQFLATRERFRSGYVASGGPGRSGRHVVCRPLTGTVLRSTSPAEPFR